MKIADVHSIVKEKLGPWFKSAGFRRSKSHTLGFARPFEFKLLVLWFQAEKWGWDPYQGAGFRFLVTTIPEGSPTRDYEQSFQYFLTDQELEEVRTIQNVVIETLPKPPEPYFRQVAAQFRGEVAGHIEETLRGRFLPVTAPYSWRGDFFLRYYNEEHVRRWCEFLMPILPRAVQNAERNWKRDLR